MKRSLLRAVGALSLLAGMRALTANPVRSHGHATSWDALLAPYGRGAPLDDGFRIETIRRGQRNEVVLGVRGPDDAAGVEIHLLPRGCWAGIRESRSFGIGYETPHSHSPRREEVTEAIAAAIRLHDAGLPAPDAIPLGPTFDRTCWARTLSGGRGAMLGASLALLAGVAVTRSRALASAGVVTGAASIVAGAIGFGLPSACPIGGAADFLDAGVRAIQAGWVVLLLTLPLLCWRAGRGAGVGGLPVLAACCVSAALALAAVAGRPDAPLHANGHAWGEARQVLAPAAGRETSPDLFLHGRGAIALEWLVAGAERAVRGRADPFRISRLAHAGAAAATALSTAVLTRSAWAGLGAGSVLAFMPLATMLAVSGSALAIPAWLLPWSLALVLAAAAGRDRGLLAGAALAAALATLSHTAMLAWPPALIAAWAVVAPRDVRAAPWVFGAWGLVAAAWVVQAANCWEMIATRSSEIGGGLLAAALIGLRQRNLLLDSTWVSPMLVPLAVAAVVIGLGRDRSRATAGTAIALAVVAIPLLAVHECSSDAARYQSVLLALTTSLATAGLWSLPVVGRSGAAAGLLRIGLLGTLVALPTAAHQQPDDPSAVEHRLVEDAVRRMDPDTLVVLPRSNAERSPVIYEFPDFLLPEDARVAFAGDPGVDAHRGPRLAYLGVACLSWADDEAVSDPPDMRPECRALRDGARPWLVQSFRPADLPRARDGRAWTFHRLTTDVPFGFFALDAAAAGGPRR